MATGSENNKEAQYVNSSGAWMTHMMSTHQRIVITHVVDDEFQCGAGDRAARLFLNRCKMVA